MQSAKKTKKLLTLIVAAVLFTAAVGAAAGGGYAPLVAFGEDVGAVTDVEGGENENIMIFNCGEKQVKIELCTARTVRVSLSLSGSDGYRPYDPQYYMVQKNDWAPVEHTVTQSADSVSIFTDCMEVRVNLSPMRIGMYDLSGNLISKDSDEKGMYADGNTVGVRKTEATSGAGGIFGFGSGDHGRRDNLNRYDEDFDQFTMSHGRLIAPFFMSTVGYGIFLNTIEEDTVFFKRGGGFETQGYLDYFFMYGPDFKTILNEYAEITGRMELYGKWAHGFMLSKYGNDNATQKEFSEWLHRLRDEGYPTDCYVFDYGWRGDVADNGGNQTGAGEKWGKQMWNNDLSKFPDIDAMFKEADELGFRVGLHNNAGTPEANGGKTLYLDDSEWVRSYMDSVITTGYGDWFWPDEFDVLGSNTAPVFAAKGAYEAWKEYTVESRPMFITRGSYAGQHFASAWSGDINNTSDELAYQIGFSIDAGLVGYWATSHDLGGFMKAPSDELYTRWVAEFGAWNGIMRAHGHDGREPWLYSETAQETLKKNLKIRYALYPYIYTMAWQGYSQGVPMMRAMILEDGSRLNADAYDLNRQYYFGDWFLVAPAADETDTTVSVWLPPHTTWYNYYNGKRYEGGETGKTIRVAAALEDIPVFVKAGAIVPMGPEVDYADEKPLDPLTLDIYPSGTASYTLYEDDGVSRRYITENAYTTTGYTCIQEGGNIAFVIGKRENHNEAVYMPDERSYNLQFNHLGEVRGVTLNGEALVKAADMAAYNAFESAYYYDGDADILYVRLPDDGEENRVEIVSDGMVLPPEGSDDEGEPPLRVDGSAVLEAENAVLLPTENGKAETASALAGYTGSGYVAGFTAKGDAVSATLNIVRGGVYTLTLKVNCTERRTLSVTFGGHTLEAQTEAASGWKSIALTFPRTDGGGTELKIAAAESGAEIALDSVSFTRQDTSLDAFSTIKATDAVRLQGAELSTDGETTSITTLRDGAYARFAEVRGKNRGAICLRVKSEEGGTITVFESGIGDKILAEIEVPGDGQWHVLEARSRDVDATEGDVYLEFSGLSGGNPGISLEWFKFTRSINAFEPVEAVSADVRNNINIRNDSYLVNIYDGSYAMFTDIDFGDTGTKTVSIVAASQNPGGKATVYIDAIGPSNAIGEIIITSTGSWNTKQTFYGNLKHTAGKHDVYIVFENDTDLAICDFFEMRFYENAVSVLSEIIGGKITAQASDIMALPGETVIMQLYGAQSGKQVSSISAVDASGKPVELKEETKGERYSFVMPDAIPVTITVRMEDKLPVIGSETTLETEDGYGATNDALDALRIDKEWSGYSGDGYVAGWKKPGSYAEIKAEVSASGVYSIILRGAAGKKNDSTDASPRSGAFYIDGVKVCDFGLEIQDGWDVWIEKKFPDARLTAGAHTFRIAAEGGNAGNFNLDCITFIKVADFTALEESIARAEAVDVSKYEEDGVAHMNALLEQAKTAAASVSTAQNTADELAKALSDAVEALQEKSEPPVHEHKFGEYKTVKAATCAEEGLMRRECECGFAEEKVIPPTGRHEFKDGTCVVCGASDPDYTPSDPQPGNDADEGGCGGCASAKTSAALPVVMLLAAAAAIKKFVRS